MIIKRYHVICRAENTSNGKINFQPGKPGSYQISPLVLTQTIPVNDTILPCPHKITFFKIDIFCRPRSSTLFGSLKVRALDCDLFVNWRFPPIRVSAYSSVRLLRRHV